jgi:ketose-bisphosphate aldolase
MSIVTSQKMLLDALENGYAVGAFNITNFMEMRALIETAVQKRAPLIIQTTEIVARFLGKDAIVSLFKTLAEPVPIPVCLHLDHCSDVRFAKQCADAGYTSIMLDASKNAFADNIKKTQEVCNYCHSLGIPVEGELGTIAGFEDQEAIAEDDASLCRPQEAVAYVAETGVNFLAPAVGTAHGIYKVKNPKLDFERLREIHHRLNAEAPKIPLVIHGGTGIPADSARKLIANGVAKFNVSTELKKALIETTYAYISEHRYEYLPERIDVQVKAVVMEKVREWIELLGCAGKA